MERRLAAILAADIVGYSRLVGLDEEGTLEALGGLKREVIGPAVASHHGRVVKFLGDGLLAEFTSVSDALGAAVQIQRETAQRNDQWPEERRIRHRIGIHQGDIVIEDDDVYGDTVNIAARLEGLAEPEGIAISEKVRADVEGRFDIDFRDLGLQSLKNIRTPVRVYRVRLSSPGTVSPPTSSGDGDLTVMRVVHDIKPAIAVLPLENMSGDPEQDYFADGITEDVITALSRVRWLFVVARNSSFAYKSKTADIREVGRDLGARYVLEGSVRRAGNRVRVTAQLIDAGTGNHVWADRYDRVLEDIFDLQEEIAETIAARIEPELGHAERDRAQGQVTQDLGAWDLYQRGMWHLYRFTAEDADRARSLFRAAIDRDPRFSSAYTGLAYQQLYDVMNGYSSDFEQSLAESEENVRRALALDDKDALARFTLGRLYTLKGEYETAMQEFELGAELNPGFAQIYHGMGFALAFGGRPEESIPLFEKAIRLSPHDAHLTSFMAVRAYAYLTQREYEHAVESADGAIRQANAMVWPHVFRTSALGHLGHPRAEASLRELLGHTPGLTCDRVRQLLYYVREAKDLDHCVEGLAKAGLPP